MKNYRNYWWLFLFFVLPASTNYKLEGFSLGSAGGGQVGSSNYSINGVAGEVGGNPIVGSSYGIGPGLVFAELANVPKITVDNPGNYYNKLHFVVDTQGNPGDALYAIAISSDNFVTTQYIKSDGTIGSSLAFTDYQNYNAWGGSTGSVVSGLLGSTTYSFKAKAWQGKYSETNWGPVATGATVAPTLTFEIDVSATDTHTLPPYAISLGDLYPSNVVNSPVYVWVSLDTNAASGGGVFIYGQNGGLKSVTAGYTIATVNGDLSSGGIAEGYGVQGVGATQTAGQFLILSPYNGSGNVIGSVNTLVNQIFTATTPVTSGRAHFLVKAKSSTSTPEASDYSESMTVIASANF